MFHASPRAARAGGIGLSIGLALLFALMPSPTPAAAPGTARKAPAADAKAAKPAKAPEIEPRAVLKGHESNVWAVAFSADGKTLASGGAIDPIRLWDPADGSPKPNADQQFKVYSLAWSPDGKTLAALFEGTRDMILDPLSGEYRFLEHADETGSLLFDPKTGLLLRGGATGNVTFHDLKAEDKVVKTIKGKGRLAGLALSPDGTTLAAGTLTTPPGEDDHLADVSVTLWDVKSGRVVKTIKGERAGNASEFVPAVRFSPDGKTLLYRASDRKFVAYDLKAGKPLRQFEAPEPLTLAAFSPDGRFAAAARDGDEDADEKAQVYLWDTQTGRLAGRPAGVGKYVGQLAFSPDGATLAAGSEKLVLLWAVPSGAGSAKPPAGATAPKPATPKGDRRK